MGTGGSLRDPHLEELYGQLDALKDHARQVAGGLSPNQLSWHPAAGEWSVGQCFEHLIITGGLYYGRIEDALGAAEKSADAAARWRPSFMGRILIKSVTTSKRLKRPRQFKPPAEPRVDVLEAFLQSVDRLAALMRQADGVNLSRVKISSPVSRVFRLNLGDCFTVLVLHAKRHLRQAARAAESRRLPRTATDDSKGM
jgi:hypothetical protein